MVKLDTFEGHIVLLCKNWYKYDDLMNALTKVWAIRCGYDHEFTDHLTYRAIANDMLSIIQKCMPDKMPWVHRTLHDGLATYPAFWKPKNLTPIQVLIWEYYSILSNMQVKESKGSRYYALIQLPRPQKRIFNRIIKGEGEYKDYERITKADKR